MYFQRYMFDSATREREWAICQAVVGVWLDGVGRQQQAHAHAVSTFYAERLDRLRLLSEASDTEQFAARLLSCTFPEPIGLAALSADLGGIAIDTHRKLQDLVGSHVTAMTWWSDETVAAFEKPRREAANNDRPARQR